MKSHGQLRRIESWTAFVAASERVHKGSYSLDLVRHARVFSTAPAHRYERLISIIGAAAKMGDTEAIQIFGRKLYTWAEEKGYEIS